MSLTIEQNLASGVPQTFISGFAPRGVGWHWTAGGTGRAGALATIQHFITTRLTVNASYHILLWVEHAAGHVGCRTFAMVIVPLTNAAHSVAPSLAFVPKTGSATEKARFTETRRILGVKASDPNAGMIAVSYCGMPAGLAADLKCAVFREDARALAKYLIDRPSVIDSPHFGHGWIQPQTRYETDITTGGADLLIGPVLYDTAEEGDMKFTNPIVTQMWDTVPGPASTFTRPDGTQDYFLTSERVKSVAEGSVGGVNSRLLDYGSNHEALTIPRTGLTNPGARIVGSPAADCSVQDAKIAGLSKRISTAKTALG